MVAPDLPALAQLEFLDVRGNAIDFEGDTTSAMAVAALRDRGVEVLSDPQIVARPGARFVDRRVQWLFDQGVATTLDPGTDAEAFADGVRTIRMDFFDEELTSLRMATYPSFGDGLQHATAFADREF